MQRALRVEKEDEIVPSLEINDTLSLLSVWILFTPYFLRVILCTFDEFRLSTRSDF